ncbi:fasciclin domain-containing protein [Primorskyibacter sp. S87]|uniref:fasciclin domain-containing protein n=1 Tax=Primorskyibacter sp. S87 TaxID=3415126 RepID=UPI003C7CF8FE
MPGTQTIKELAAGNPDFSILVSALSYLDTQLNAGLLDLLDADSTDATVFAPTNAAFGKLAQDLGFAGDAGNTSDVTAFLVANVPAELLLQVVQYHVSPGTQLAADVAAATELATLNPSMATIGVDLPTLVDNEPDLLDPTLVSTDNMASNGVVHAIDRVLLPVDLPGNDAPTITGILNASGSGFDQNAADFDILRTAVETAKLDGLLDDSSIDVTAFAPTDGAFVNLAQALGYGQSDEEGAWGYLVEALTLLGGGDPIPLLTQVLQYHVAGESLQASQVLSSMTIPTLQGGSLGVNGTQLQDADPDIADPNIIVTDIQAANGIVHGIDGVLLPADLLQSNGSNDVDFIIGGNGGEKFITGRDHDLIDGNGGDDLIFAGNGKDVAFGGTGDDLLHGGRGMDQLSGNEGNDVLIGARGSDVLNGGAGNDDLLGGRGNDILNGGKGNDILFGNGGADTFVIEKNSGFDTIVDFGVGKDKIDLRDFAIEGGFHAIEEDINEGLLGTSVELGDGSALYVVGLGGVHLGADDFIF